MEKIFQTLASLGLSEAEAQIYVFLAQQGPKRTEQIKDQLNIGNKELAATLVSLTKKGFVEAKCDQSTIFSIIPFEIVLQRLIDSKKEQINLLREDDKVV